MSSNEKCPICLEFINETKDYCVTNCKHLFHLSCILKTINRKCPLCRSKIEEHSEENYKNICAIYPFFLIGFFLFLVTRGVKTKI